MADEQDDTTSQDREERGRDDDVRKSDAGDRATRRDADDRDDTGGGNDEKDASQLGDAGKRAIDAMKRERNAAKKDLADVQAELRKFTDAQKSEGQRLQETAQQSTARADKAESGLRAMQVALDRAPDGATIAQVRAVAKRVRGDDDEALESDADELYTLLAPGKPEQQTKVPTTRPTERLRGGTSPEDDLEETDAGKLADLINRN
jgi:hypothetical protein